jgi:hypothetical protein
MKNVTKQEVIDFIKSQPDDREVDMQQSNSDYKCGCVMVHYAQDVLNKKDVSCGYYDFISFFEDGSGHSVDATLEESIDRIVGKVVWEKEPKTTYGRIKELMGL